LKRREDFSGKKRRLLKGRFGVVKNQAGLKEMYLPLMITRWRDLSSISTEKKTFGAKKGEALRGGKKAVGAKETFWRFLVEWTSSWESV